MRSFESPVGLGRKEAVKLVDVDAIPVVVELEPTQELASLIPTLSGELCHACDGLTAEGSDLRRVVGEL